MSSPSSNSSSKELNECEKEIVPSSSTTSSEQHPPQAGTSTNNLFPSEPVIPAFPMAAAAIGFNINIFLFKFNNIYYSCSRCFMWN
jgi:hypothetical protein